MTVRIAVVFLLLSVVSCAPVDDFTTREYGYLPVDGFCTSRHSPRSLAQWAIEVPIVIVARVDDVRRLLPDAGYAGNHCWAHVDISETLKGSAAPSMWVKVFFSDRTRDGRRQDRGELHHCPLMKDSTYLLFGYHGKPPIPSGEAYMMMGYRDIGTCTPILELVDPTTLQNIRAAVNQGRNL